MKRFVLLDFDGVIADSVSIVNEVALLLCKELTPEKHMRHFEGNINDGDGAVRTLQHGPECQHDLDWWEAYRPRFHRAVPFEGAIDSLRQIARDYTIIIISSTISELIREFLIRNDALECVAEILGNDVHERKTEKIRMVFEKYETVADECVFVTDTLGDLREAAEVGVGGIAVSWGFHDRSTLERGVPFRIVEKSRDIPDAINEYFITARN